MMCKGCLIGPQSMLVMPPNHLPLPIHIYANKALCLFRGSFWADLLLLEGCGKGPLCSLLWLDYQQIFTLAVVDSVTKKGRPNQILDPYEPHNWVKPMPWSEERECGGKRPMGFLWGQWQKVNAKRTVCIYSNDIIVLYGYENKGFPLQDYFLASW